MLYEGYHFMGMHLIWWFFWIVFILWIFVTPFYLPVWRMKNDSPLYLLHKQIASGQITSEEFQERKKFLEKQAAKQQ